MSIWAQTLLAKLESAVSTTAGSGISSTKVVWFSNGMLACYCATLASIGGVSKYLFQDKADPVYWTAVSALWIASMGFATSAKKSQNQTTKEISIASQQTAEPGTPDQGGTS